ncbi:MAG TPA: SRPBCC family protein [Acidimicrobiales bacterium]|nr:SRPBCC family protein [Acidimicrobiales bacterium]
MPNTSPRTWTIEATARTSAPVEAVWPLIGEAARWKDWSFMTRTFLLREGDPAPDGVGAIRRFALGPGGSKEEVVAWEPPHHLGYKALSGLPVKSYSADVYLESDGNGTVVTWRSRFVPLVPGTGALVNLWLRRLVRGFATGVCRYADRIGAGTS